MQKKYAIDNLFILSEKRKKKNTQKSEGDGEKKDTCLLLDGTKAKANKIECRKLIKFLLPWGWHLGIK